MLDIISCIVLLLFDSILLYCISPDFILFTAYSTAVTFNTFYKSVYYMLISATALFLSSDKVTLFTSYSNTLSDLY